MWSPIIRQPMVTIYMGQWGQFWATSPGISYFCKYILSYKMDAQMSHPHL